MASFIDKIGDFVRGQASSGAVIDGALDVRGSERRELVTQHARGRTFMQAYNRFTRPGVGRVAVDPSYGPRQMGADISYMRDEALRLAMVNPHADRAVHILTNWTIMSGVNFIVKARGKQMQKRVVEAVKTYFIDSTECDSSKHGNYWALERLIVSYYFRAGEVLIRARPRDFSDGLTVPVAFEVIDPVMLFDSGMPPKDVNGNTVEPGNTFAAGIEFDPLNAPAAYWLYQSNPRDSMIDRTPVRVPVKDKSGQVQIVHLFEKFFPGQIRGVPRAVRVNAITLESQDLAYSILRRHRMTAKVGLVLKEGANATENPNLPGMNGAAAGEDTGAATRIDRSELLEFIEDGLMRDNAVLPMPPGWDVDQLTLQNMPEYKDFLRDMRETQAAGWGVPYSMLTTDLTQVSFSGGKLGLLDFRNERLSDQNYFRSQLHLFVWSNFCTAANRAGLWADRNIGVEFRYDAFPSAEAEKDAKIVDMRLRNGTISPQRACAEFGEDFYEIVDEIADADEYLRQKGLNHLTSEEIAKKVTSTPAAADESDDEDGPDKGAAGSKSTGK